MKSLFEENFRWTDRALSAADEIEKTLFEVYEKLTSEGYSPREVTALAVACVNQVEVQTILNLDWKRREETRR